ncbi:MAG: ATP-binding protein [Thomasclavelia sp.]|nr:ATP-binding protein [Thomasclavelia sp.]
MPEIAMNILDIVYNSIRAKATLIKIIINDSIKNNIIDILVEDNGCGMDEETLKNVTNPFYTTRTTRNVGLGIPLLKESAINTGGKFNISSIKGSGTKISCSFVKDNIDTPAMGDIVETMITLIQGDENIDYIFEYKTDKNDFKMNTKEIKEILDGVEINKPEILLWLKDYMKEGLNL